MVTKVPDTAIYAKLKAWLSTVEDWVASHLGTTLKVLGPYVDCTVVQLTMTMELYAILERMGVLGLQKGRGHPLGDTMW